MSLPQSFTVTTGYFSRVLEDAKISFSLLVADLLQKLKLGQYRCVYREVLKMKLLSQTSYTPDHYWRGLHHSILLKYWVGIELEL